MGERQAKYPQHAMFMAASGLCVADDATSPPPVGLAAFSRKVARQPFTAIQMQAVPNQPASANTADEDCQVKQCPVSPLKQVSRQARFRYALPASPVFANNLSDFATEHPLQTQAKSHFSKRMHDMSCRADNKRFTLACSSHTLQPKRL